MMMIVTVTTRDHVHLYDDRGNDDDDDEDHLNEDKDGLSLITMGCDDLPVRLATLRLHCIMGQMAQFSQHKRSSG